MAFKDPPNGTIYDPLAKFYDEGTAPKAGERNPVTGIREPTDNARKKLLREDEGKRKEAVSKRVITQLMNDDLGREWLLDWLNRCNVFGTPYTVDPYLTAYNSGALFIGRMLEVEIKRHSIKEYFLMCEEAYDRDKNWEMDAADK